MPVDMLISRFMQELLTAVPSPFQREGKYDPNLQKRQLPPYRHVFQAICLFEHSAGYHLPRYQTFKEIYLRALKRNNRYKKDLAYLLPAGEPTSGLLYRIGGWYLNGLAHTHLYCVLVQAYEEQRRVGAVMMDARVDAKLKTDIAIVTPSASVRVDIRFTDGVRQDDILATRSAAEMVAKANNSSSSQVANPFYERAGLAVVSGMDMETHVATGVPLFVPRAIDRLISEIDRHLKIDAAEAISYADMKDLSMSNLQRRSGRSRRGVP